MIREYLFFLTLFVCALTDIAFFRIKNFILLGSALLLLLCDRSLSSLPRAGLIFLFFIPFYLLGRAKAGDIKLLMLTAMYAGFEAMVPLFLLTVLSSVMLLLIISRIRKTPPADTGYPFAFAMFLGALPLWNTYL